MPKKPTAYHRPKDLQDALNLLLEPGTVPLAGGTALLAGDVSGAVVDLQDLGLDQIADQDGRLRVGSMARLVDLMSQLPASTFFNTADDVFDQVGLLDRAIYYAGPNTYRNSATIGGIIASRLADSELLATLLVMDAELTLLDPERKQMSLDEYLLGDEKPAALIIGMSYQRINGQGSSHRVARTPADDPIVSVTAWQPDSGHIRLAATGLRSRPYRLMEAENSLVGGKINTAVDNAAAAAKGSADHEGDFRGDAHYRAEMGSVLTKRALMTLYRDLEGR